MNVIRGYMLKGGIAMKDNVIKRSDAYNFNKPGVVKNVNIPANFNPKFYNVPSHSDLRCNKPEPRHMSFDEAIREVYYRKHPEQIRPEFYSKYPRKTR